MCDGIIVLSKEHKSIQWCITKTPKRTVFGVFLRLLYEGLARSGRLSSITIQPLADIMSYYTCRDRDQQRANQSHGASPPFPLTGIEGKTTIKLYKQKRPKKPTKTDKNRQNSQHIKKPRRGELPEHFYLYHSGRYSA